MLGTESMGGENKGILPRCFEQMFSASKSSMVEISVSYLQIYCEMVEDLLLPSGDSSQLSIREKNGSVFVDGLSKSRVMCTKDVIDLLELGDRNRSTAPTLINPSSSRSHAALIVNISFLETMVDNIHQLDPVERSKRESTLVLVDLAGSERSAAAGGNYIRLEETKNINLSLSALGNCMSALAEGRYHIPYRDSKLTRLLQGSLGGGCRTAVIVNIYSGADSSGEVLRSLKFASRASKVEVIAKVSRYIDYEAMYFRAQQELDRRGENEKQLMLNLSTCKTEIQEKEEQIQNLLENIDTLKIKLSQSKLNAESYSLEKADDDEEYTVTESTINVMPVTNKVENLDLRIMHMDREHHLHLSQIKNTYEVMKERERQKTHEALQEVGRLQYELQSTQEQALMSVLQLKKEKELIRCLTKDSSDRIEELLCELNDCKDKIDVYEEALSLFPKEIKELEEKLHDSKRKTSEMIPIFKVKEMEAMFMQTVNKLSNRVNSLENAMQAHSACHEGCSRPVNSVSGWKDRLKSNNSAHQSNLPPIPKSTR